MTDVHTSNPMEVFNPKAIWPMPDLPTEDGQLLAGFTCPKFSSVIERDPHKEHGLRVELFILGFNERDEIDDLPLCRVSIDTLDSLIRMLLHTRSKAKQIEADQGGAS